MDGWRKTQNGGSENDQPVATYTLVGTNKTQRELTLAAEQIVQKGFERVNGVGRVALGVQNLTDAYYVTYFSDTAGPTDNDRFFSGRGRSVTLGLTRSF